jgi:dTDP-3,4-didehydro-2,6-dideoxy-alpha-D-glucose 3-reductase
METGVVVDAKPPVRVGVIGCADIAWRRVLPALVSDEDVQLSAVASRDRAKAEVFADHFGCDAAESYDGLLARPDIDAVYVPLPTMLHGDWVERALLAGHHVLAEKPLTSDPGRTAALVGLARRLDRVLLENVMFVHHSQHEAVRRLVLDGAIGEVRGFFSEFTIPPRPDDDIRYRPDLGGGALLDVGVYPVRAAMHFLGHALEVAGATMRCDRGRDVVVSGAALLTTPRGVPAQISFGMEHAYRSQYRIIGSDGVLSVDRAFTPSATWRPTVLLERQDGREVVQLAADDQCAATVRFFVRAVRGQTDCGPHRAATTRQAELVHEIAAKATPSAT